MTNVEIIFLIIAIAFVALVVFLIKCICSVSKTLDTVQQKLKEMDQEPEKLVRNVNELSKDVTFKLKCLNPLFRTFYDLSSALEARTARFRNGKSQRCSIKEKLLNRESREEKLEDILNLAMAFVRLFK